MLRRFRYILILIISLAGSSRVAAQLAMPDSVCIGATKHYWVNGGSGSTYSWSINGAPLPSNTNEIYQTWSAAGDFVLTVQETTVEGCVGPLSLGHVIVNAAVSSFTGKTICSSDLPYEWNGSNYFATGIYADTLTSAVGCDSVATLNLVVHPTASSTTDITACNSFLWNGNTYYSSGIYPVLFPAGSALGCDSTAVLNLTIHPLLSPTFSAIGPLCQNSPPPLLQNISLEGISGSWTPPVIDTSIPGSSTYTFTPDGGECANVTTLTIDIESLPLINISTVINVNCFGGNNGSATAFVNGINSPFIYQWNDPMLQNTPTASNLAAGTYSVEVTDSHGCTSTSSVIITQPLQLSASVSGNNITCFGAANGMIQINNPSGGSGSYEYSIDGSNWNLNGLFINLSPGTYISFMRDAAAPGCFRTLSTITITEPSANLDATAVITDVSCPGYNDGSINLSISGGTLPYAISWSNTTMTEDISGLTAGTYYVSITDANGCNFLQSYQVNTIPDVTAPVISCPAPMNMSANSSCEIVVPDLTSLASVSDNCGNPTISQLPLAGSIITGVTAGQLIVIDIFAIDGSGNPASCQTSIIVDNSSPIAVNDHVSTNEDSPALFTILINDDFGCDGPNAGTIQIMSGPSNGSAVVNDSGTPGNPADDQLLYTPYPNFNGSDTLTYRICDSNGDCSTATVFIGVIPVNDPPVTVNEAIELCEGTVYSGQVLNGDSDIDGTLLAVSLVPVSGPMHGSFSIDAAGSYNYLPAAGYSGTDQVIVNICDSGIPGVACSRDTIFIKISKLVIANAGADYALCNESTTNLMGNTPFPGVGNWSILSGPSTPFISPANSSLAIASGLISSSIPYIFEYTISNNSCISNDQVTVINYEVPSTSYAGPDQNICSTFPVSTHLAASIPIVGTGHWTQIYGPTTALIADDSDPNTLISNLAEGSYMLDWTITNGACSPSSSAVLLQIAVPAFVYAGPDDTICETHPDFVLSAASASSYQSLAWTTSGDGTFDNPSIQNPVYFPGVNDISRGIAKLTLTALGNSPCPDAADTIQLVISHQSSANAGSDATICETQAIFTLSEALASQYTGLKWSTSGTGTFSNPGILNPDYMPSAGDIAIGSVELVLTATSESFCNAAQDTMTLTIIRQAIADAGNDTKICENQVFPILTAAASNYTTLAWTSTGDGTFDNPSIPQPTYTPGQSDILAGTVILTMNLTSNSPCISTSDSMILDIYRQAVAEAGPDYTLCETQLPFKLNSASASNYTNLFWSSSGDGTFSDPAEVHPEYFPGPTDLANGSVTLTINGNSAAPCLAVMDAMQLNIQRTVTGTAGPDAETCQGVPYIISGSTANYFSDINWSHNGSGILNGSSTIHPTYIPSAQEQGAVVFTLRITGTSPCTDSIIDQMILSVHPLPAATITGGTSICEGDTTMLSIQFYGTSPWNVSYSDGNTITTLTNITDNPYEFSVLPPAGTTIYTLSGLSDTYCQSTANQLQGSAVIIVNPKPVVDFSANEACEGDTTFLVASGSNSMKISHWTWNFGDGSYGVYNTPNDPVHVYPSYGRYLVTLTVEDTNGCYYTTSHPVDVRPHPQSFFNFNTPNCSGNNIEFSDLSINPQGQGYLKQWNWNFGDGTPIQSINFPDSPNISHSYLVAGTYTVSLTVVNSMGCKDIYSSNITITPTPVADFSVQSNCEGEMASFYDSSTTNGNGPVTTWEWNFGDAASGSENSSNLQNPHHVYTSAGTYMVKLIVTNYNGCSDTIQKPVNIHLTPAVEFTSSPGCVGTPTIFQIDSSVVTINSTATYSWWFGDGGTANYQNPSHIYQAPGSYTVVLVITDLNGCSRSISHIISVSSSPEAAFSVNMNNCAHETIYFEDHSSTVNGNITNWLWDFGDGTTTSISFPDLPNIHHSYQNAGIYSVTLTVTNNLSCTGTKATLIQVFDAPVADFISEGNCIGNEVSFTDLTVYQGSQSLAGWTWNFGDPSSGVNNTSSLQNPVHTYTSAGTYTIQLISTSNTSCSDSISRSIVIKPLPVVEFSFSGTCAGNPVSFIPNSSGMSLNTITSWLWTFGDGNFSLQALPTHVYSTSGIYIVSLTISDTSGCSSTISQAVVIGAQPEVSFEVSQPGCSQASILFSNTSQVSSGFISYSSWDFGDGSTMVVPFPGLPTQIHTYANAGSFIVTLTVKTSDSCSSSFSKTISISTKPNADFTAVNGCQGNLLEFNDGSTVTGSNISGWAWDFGDPSSGTSNYSELQNPQHSFAQAGLYTIWLIVFSNAGCSDTTSKEITISSSPVVNFSVQASCSSDTTHFNSSNFVNLSTTQSWFWQFGDGLTSSLTDPEHIYASTGSYVVTLTITDAGGCTASLSSPVNIVSVPTAYFAATSPGCRGNNTTFTDLSNSHGNTISLWKWSFGDGSVATFTSFQVTVNHTYSLPGTFVAKLSIYTQNGCESTTQQLITIAPGPDAGFNFQDLCEGETTHFHDQSIPENGIEIISWNWDFGDPASGINNSSTLQNPSHLYSSPGQYSVVMVCVNAAGCSDTVQQTVFINSAPSVDYYHDAVSCLDNPVGFFIDPEVTNLATIQQYDWNFGDGSPHSTLPNPVHTYTTSSTYFVTLLITDLAGCSNSVTHEILIHEAPIAGFKYQQSCVQNATKFNDASVPPVNGSIVKWAWDFGISGSLSDTSDLQDPEFTYSMPGTYVVTLTVTSDSGCRSSRSQAIQIWNNPTAGFRFSTTPCSNGAVQFQDTSYSNMATITSWLWEFEPFQYSSSQNPVYSYFKTDTCYLVNLTIADLHGCIDSTQELVCVPAGFNAMITAQPTCARTPVQFNPQILSPLADEIHICNWNFGDPLSGSSNTSNLINPSHTFEHSGYYTIILLAKDKYGCSTEVTSIIEVHDPPEASFTWTNSQLGTTIDFENTSTNGSSEFAQIIWDFGDGSGQILMPPGSTTHHDYESSGTFDVTLTVNDRNGCSSAVSIPIPVNAAPQAAFEISNLVICQNTAITVNNLSKSSIQKWVWNWGDNTADETDTTYHSVLSHTYNQPGSYKISLKIFTLYNGNLVSDSISNTIHVQASPVASFITNRHCLGEQTEFNNMTDAKSESGMLFSWNFGDPDSGSDSSIVQNPRHVFSKTGLFSPRLIATNTAGCSDTTTKSVLVNGLPNAEFTSSTACQGNLTFFFDHSKPAADALKHWGWRIGNSPVSGWMSGQNPSFVFDTVGVYPVLLSVTDVNGCLDTIIREITVYPSPVSAFNLEDHFENEQGKIHLVNGSIDGVHYYWDFGNDEHSSDESPTVTYGTDGTYLIRLYTTNEHGCTDSSSFDYKLMFKGLYVPNAFSPDDPAQAVRYWKPVGINLAYYQAEIYDRWGTMIWSSTKLDEKGSPVESWDGSYKGKPIATGEYIWTIRAVFRDGMIWRNTDVGNHENLTKTTSGTITLIR